MEAEMELLTTVKKAVGRDYTTAYDNELQRLITAALNDLALSGITGATTTTESPLIIQAVCTYCAAHFSETDEYEHLKKFYDEQKAQLMISSEHTDYEAYGITSYLERQGKA